MNIDYFNRISTTDTRLIRRIVRDYNFRGYSALETLKRWPSVNAGEDKNIFPFQENADVMFNSSLVYELAILSKYALPLLEAVSYTHLQPGIASYDSIVSRNNLYGKNSINATDMLIKGGTTDDGVLINSDIRVAYLSALARFRASAKKLSAEDRYQINKQISFTKSNI